MAFNPTPAPASPYPQGTVPPGWQSMPPAQPVQPPAKPGWQQDIKCLVLVALVVAAHTLVNVYWLHEDNHLIHLDEAHHIGRSVAFHQALFPGEGEGLLSRALALLSLESPYPPLSHIAGAVFIRVFGYAPDTVALSGSFALALLLFGVYALARVGMTASNAFFTVLVTSLIPMVYGYSRLVMPDTLCGALVVWALFGLAKSDMLRRTGWTAFFGVVFGLALLAKQTAFVYLALPFAMALCRGITDLLRPASAEATPGHKKTDALLHAGLCGFILAALCSWWYLRHLEYLYTWWSTQRGLGGGLFQPGIAAPLSAWLPAVTEAPEMHIALDPALTHNALPTGESVQSYPFASLLEPFETGWQRYLIYLVNEVLFLPLTVFAFLGILALPLKRNRTLLVPVLIAWMAGSYVLLTGLFALNSPRFLYAMAPAPAFFAVFALDAVPQVKLRRVLWGLFLGVLALQFVNISLLPFGPIRRVETPVLADHPDALRRGNSGLTLYKDIIQTGNYVIHAPQTGTQVTEAALNAMAQVEITRGEATGAAAWYQVVSPVQGALGTDFYARSHGPAPNPFRPVSAEAIVDTPRPFVAVKERSLTPEGTLPELAETDYVVMQTPLAGEYMREMEQEAAFFSTYGFKSIFNATFEGYGPAVPCLVHVMARKKNPEITEISNLFDAYDMLDQDGKSYLLSDEARRELEQVYAREVSRHNEIRALSDRINLLGFHVAATAENWFVVRLIVHVAEPPNKNLRIWLRATCHEDDRSRQFPEHRDVSELVWDFQPEPPATEWRRNEALVLTRPVMVRPLRYQVDIGVYDPESEEAPKTVIGTEWVDFSLAE